MIYVGEGIGMRGTAQDLGRDGLGLVLRLGVEREVRGLGELGQLVEVEVAVRVRGRRVDRLHGLQVLLGRRQLALQGRDGGQLRGSQVDVRALAQSIRKVARRRRHDRRGVRDPRLVAHAQGTPRHLHARAGLAEDRIISFLGELRGVHPRGRRNPQPRRRDAAVGVEQLPRSPKMPNVRHARPKKDFVDLRPRDLRQRPRVVRVVGRAEDRLLDLVEVNFNDLGYSALASASMSCGLSRNCSMRATRRCKVRASPYPSATIHFSMTMLLLKYSQTGSGSNLMEQPAADRSADASDNSKACSHFKCPRPSISNTRPEKMFFLPCFSTVNNPRWMAAWGIA